MGRDHLMEFFGIHRQHRGNKDPGGDPGMVQLFQGLHAAMKGWRPGLQDASNVLVFSADGEPHRGLRHRQEDVQISHDQGRSCQNFHLPLKLTQDLQTPSAELPSSFYRLVGVADAGKHDGPSALFATQLRSQEFDKVCFALDKSAPSGLLMAVGIFPHKGGVAIPTSVATPEVGVDCMADTGDFGSDQGSPGLYFNYVHFPKVPQATMT
jgi:hypothetical protein